MDYGKATHTEPSWDDSAVSKETLKELGLRKEQVEVWDTLPGSRRVLLIWRWLRKALVESNLNKLDMQLCKGDLTAMLEAYYGMAKVKMHGVEKTPLSIIEAPIFYIMMIVFLPHVLAMQFFQDLQLEHLRKGYQYHPTRFLEFFVGMSTVVFFFQSLRLVCDQFMDPFGKDVVDMHLDEFRHSLFDDLDALVKDAEPERGHEDALLKDAEPQRSHEATGSAPAPAEPAYKDVDYNKYDNKHGVTLIDSYEVVET